MTDFKRTLLTGAAGALGVQLRKSGPKLGKLVRLSALEPCRDLAPHEEDSPADLADSDAVSAAVRGCDAIVHMGGQGLEAPWKMILNSNIVASYNIYEAARRHDVKRIVYASSVTRSVTTSAPRRSTAMSQPDRTASMVSRRLSSKI